MQTDVRTGQKTSGTTEHRTAIEKLPSDALPLGVDGENAAHHFSRIAGRVVVEHPTRGVERVVDLDGRTLASWIGYVDTQRGWVTLNYADTFADVLSEALEAGS